MLRVVVAEDSPTARRHLSAMISSDPRFELAGVAEDGEQAVEMAVRLAPDVMTMDIHMPRLDGVAATERIMASRPCPIVVISGGGAGDANFAFRALRAGALEIVRKPEAPDTAGYERVRRSILDTLALMAGVKVVRRWAPRAPQPAPRRERASVVGVCASTGGPPALEAILRMAGGVRAPLLVVQHIAVGFAQNLVQWLNATSAIPVELATEGKNLAGGHAYLAPDDRHLTVRDGAIALVDAPPVRHHRPSGDMLFSSLAENFGSSAVGVILTGMGSDGTNGLRELHARGGHVIAQEESTCAIASMPRAAIEAQAVDEVLPLCDIARRVRELA
jgi:two-component system chemotaxis response regulator CheB